jgi:hypothetical protein
MRQTAAPSKTKRQRMLPKNGEFRRHSVGFCRLARCNIGLSWPLPTLTAVVSINSVVSRGTIVAGMRFALSLLTYKIGFPGWPEPNLDSVTGFGASITRRGLAPAPFFISSLRQRIALSAIPQQHWLPQSRFELRPGPVSPGIVCIKRNRSPASTSGSACAWEWCYWPLKKMSGRWGDRPLGRGDGGYSNPKSVWFFRPCCCAREQQDDTQEQTGHYRCITPESPNNSRLPA